MALAAREAKQDALALDRTVELARVLAERLLGEALRLDPGRVAALAKRALADARGARRVVIHACPDDVARLSHQLPSLGVDSAAVELRSDSRRLPGSLRIETEIGMLDAELGPQLDRLAERLRQSLKT